MKLILNNGRRVNLKLERCCDDETGPYPGGFSGYSGIIPTPNPCGNYRSFSFNDSTDWEGGISDGYFTIEFTHNLNSNSLITELWDEQGNPIKVFPDTLEQVSLNKILMKVCPYPDRRFSGRLVISGCSGYSGINI